MATKPPTQLGPKERFFRYFQQEVTALLQQMDSLENLSHVGGERSDAADHCLAGIARLSKEVQDASSYVPTYDQRTYGEAIKALNEKLIEIRAIFVPKSKFSFKTARKNASAISLSDAAELASQQRLSLPGYLQNASSNESSMVTSPAYCTTPPNETSTTLSEQQRGQLNKISESSNTAGSVIQKPSSTSSKAVTISSLVSQHIILPSSASHSTSSGSLTALRNCVIDMSTPTTNGQPFAGLTIKNIKSCLLVCGSVGGATHVTNVEGSVLVVTTRQFRMHDSKDCVVYLHCISRPIIEECTDIRFTPIPQTHSLNGFCLPSTPSPNQWDQVDDCKWLKTEHSPNWRILEPDQVVPDEVWKEVVPGGPVLSADDILKAVGVRKLQV